MTLRFLHKEQAYFNYCYIPTYRTYYHCYHWCRDNVKGFWNVEGDPETHIYRFAFMDSKDYVLFLLQYGDRSISNRPSEY